MEEYSASSLCDAPDVCVRAIFLASTADSEELLLLDEVCVRERDRSIENNNHQTVRDEMQILHEKKLDVIAQPCIVLQERPHRYHHRPQVVLDN